MYKRIVSAVLSVSLLLCAAYIPAAAKDEKVTLIVETEGAPLLATKNAVRMGAADYMETDEAKDTEARLLSAQSEVKSDIKKRVGADVNSGFTYTSVLNGFSMEAYESDIERIKAIDGVKNVYISEKFEIPPELASNDSVNPGFGAQMMNAQAMYDEDFDGRGQVVAVIDGAFDTSHNFFASGVAEPKLTKSSIKEFIETNEFNADISANQVYRSEKIPFAYDYADKDADTYDANVDHGNLVAGIVAGKNGECLDMTFSGVAPEAQLVLMKVADSEGSLDFSVIIKAMDDASKMGVCAVNLSIGGMYAEYPALLEATDNLRNADIAFLCAAGNSDRYEETTDHPDYIYNELPSSFSSATAVASIDPTKKLVLTGRFTVGDDMEISILLYHEPFFQKFADKSYGYVYGDTLADFKAMGDIAGKIVVTPYESDAKSNKLLEMGVIGVIYVSEDEEFDSVTTVSDEKIPGILVSKSVGEQLKNAENKTVKTEAKGTWETYEDSSPGMAWYMNWSTGANLELKPEITAPGSDIVSASNDDEYATNSGTSFASPHIAGAMALMSGFVDAKYPDVTGTDKVALMENILMSSADIVFQDADKTLPESPRRQGAGLANLEDAMTLPVILKGDTGKSKLSIKDNLTDDITLKFTAKNLTGEPVTYDDIKIYAFTDNYEEKNGKNMITNSVPLKFEPAGDNPESVTIPANGEKEITLKITLDSTQTAANKEIFTNGFWVDGFVVLSSSDSSVTEASMPYTGFYGDWIAFDAMTPSYFEEGGSEKNGGLMITDAVLGTNEYVPDDAPDKNEYESEDYVGLSGIVDFDYNINMRLLRSLHGVSKTIKDSNGNVISTKSIINGLTRQDSAGNYVESISIDAADLSDGDYSVTISGTLGYDSERSRTEEKTYKFYVDSMPPKISNPKIYTEGDKIYASFTASDNRYLMGVEARDTNSKTVTEPIKAEKNADITFDITDMDEETIEFAVVDYAYNETDFTIGSVSAEITDSAISGSSAAVFANVTNTSDDADVDIITAVYDGDGRLMGVDKQNALLVSGEKKVFTFGFDNVSGAADIKLFVWKHNEMTPLCTAVNKAL